MVELAEVSFYGIEVFRSKEKFHTWVTSPSRALCLLEALAHLSRQEIPSDYVIMSIVLPESQ